MGNYRKILTLLMVFCCLSLLLGCGGNGAQMRQQLEELEVQNRSGQQLLNDSLAETLVSYFDHHGSANERMRSRYMLGRTYYFLGELPRALETYLEASGCADTLDADCDYKVLSRIHAQSAIIFNQQVQPRSQLCELRLAEYYAWKAKDTLQAIECYSQQANAYDFLHKPDSVVVIAEAAIRQFRKIGRLDRASQMCSAEIISLVQSGKLSDARRRIEEYEASSGFFNDNGEIESGREIFYYIKGRYYLAVNQLDSAEDIFRKELRAGVDLNNKIAGCKGMQSVYEKRKISDSIAKYAVLSYELNDSVYSLSEMQNIQKLQASYNYNHQKQLAVELKNKANLFMYSLIAAVALFAIVFMIAFFASREYKTRKDRRLADYQANLSSLEKVQTELQLVCEGEANIPSYIENKNKEIKTLQTKINEYQKHQKAREIVGLEDRILNEDIINDLNQLIESNPVRPATQLQMSEVKKLINEQIPLFYESLNSPVALRPIEYEVCLLVRCHFKPAAICKLLDRSDGYIANLRKGILLKVYGVKGSPKELDERIMRIV